MEQDVVCSYNIFLITTTILFFSTSLAYTSLFSFCLSFFLSFSLFLSRGYCIMRSIHAYDHRGYMLQFVNALAYIDQIIVILFRWS